MFQMKTITKLISLAFLFGISSSCSQKSNLQDEVEIVTENQDSLQGKVKNDIPLADFKGKWSNEGDITEDSRMEIEINQTADKIDGSISYSKWDENGKIIEGSGIYALTGSIIGDTATAKLYSSNGRREVEAKLIREGENLRFIRNPNSYPYFPNEQVVWRFDWIDHM